MRDRTTPAANAPSTASNSKIAAKAMSPLSSSITTRSRVRSDHGERWLPWPGSSPTRRCSLVGTAMTASVTSTKKPMSSPACSGEWLVSSNAMTTTGPISPTAPWVKIARPSGVSVRPRSLRIGRSVPSAVEEIASPSATAWVKSTSGVMSQAKKTATTKPTVHVVHAQRPWRPTSDFSSISTPARRKSRPIPSCLIISMPCVDASPSTCGPMSTPTRRRTTTSGARPRASRPRSGATTAAAAIQKSDTVIAAVDIPEVSTAQVRRALYLPGPLLRAGENEITVLDLDLADTGEVAVALRSEANLG